MIRKLILVSGLSLGLVLWLIITLISFKSYLFTTLNVLVFLLIPVFGILIVVCFIKYDKLKIVAGYLLAFVVIPLFTVECVVKYGLKTYYFHHERNSNDTRYYSPFTVWNQNPYFAVEANSEYPVISHSEFNYTHRANNFGFCSKNPEDLDSAKMRIACFGDSFTQGYGAPMDSTWPASLAYHLANYEIINAGLAGSDPIYGIKLFKEVVGPKYHPDVLLFTINDTDLSEIAQRGGVERFQSDGSVRYKSQPWWEPLYGMSHIVRTIVHFSGVNQYFFNQEESQGLLNQSIEIIVKEFLQLEEDLQSQYPDIKVVYLVHPLNFEVTDGEYRNGLIQQFEEKNLLVLDMLDLMKNDKRINPSTYGDYYWEMDSHHNGLGYWIMGELVAQELQPLLKENLSQPE
jgi:lysophospholipase L1-like esterase